MKFLEISWQKIWLKVKKMSYAKVRIALDFCIIVAIGIIIFRNFIFTFEWPGGGDALGLVSRDYISGREFRWLYMWRPHSFGFVEVIHGYDFFLMFLHFILGNPIAIAKAFLFLTFIFSGFSSYILAFWYTRNSTASLAAALVYILNQWLFTQYAEAHGDILFSYTLAPLIFLSVFLAFERGKLKDILIAGVALAILISAFHPECLVIYGSSLPIFAITYILIPNKNNKKTAQMKKFFKVLLPLAVICFSLASFLLLPMALNVLPRYYLPTYKYFLEEMYGGVYKNLTDAFALGAVEAWGYVQTVDVVTGISLPDVPTKTFSIIIFASAYLTVFIRKDKYAIFFVISAFVAMFVAKGPYPPFGSLYVWAWLNVPYFAVFRAANRWIMMTCLSHAFLTASLVDLITRYARERRHRAIEEAFSEFGARIAWYFRAMKLKNPLRVAREFFVCLHKILYCIGIVLLILIFLNSFLSTWYFFREGLQVYSLPENYIQPYEWIARQNGDFKVISINRDPARWMGLSSGGFDFGFSAMLTKIGWGHDIGFESSFIHDKPVMQDGGWDQNTHDFVDYLRYHLVGQQLTRNFLKITGPFNYKYVVLPGYTEFDIKDFFLSQTGAVDNVVYNENNSVIIENPFYAPRFFGLSDYANILGGYEAYQLLCKIDTFNLTRANLLFASKLSDEDFEELKNDASALVLVNSNLLDLVMLRLQDEVKIIRASDYGIYSYNLTGYWVQWKSWRDEGALVFGGYTLTTVGNVSVNIPFNVDKDGTYDIWLRIGFLSNRGNLEVLVDDSSIGNIKPETDYWIGLLWVKMQTLELTKGTHMLTLRNDGTGWNDVDAIAIVEPNIFQDTYEETVSYLKSFQGRIVNIMGAANMFAYDLPEGWSIHVQKYENGLLKAESTLKMINVNPTISASSYQDGYSPERALDGSLQTRWASNPLHGLPQWLMIEFPEMQEIDGVKIYFEAAYAKDYVIQTWDGEQWITQVARTNVTESEAQLPIIHIFEKPVKTSKLLLNVTAYGTEHNLVSVYEFQPCQFSSISASCDIFKTGRYMLALRLATGPEYGTLNMQIGSYSLAFNCNASDEKFQWFEAGPLLLDEGEQEVTMNAYGKIIFDQFILYTLEQEESGSCLSHLLNCNDYSPVISYETINPTAYRVHIKTDVPFFLVFSEAYNPLWHARFDDGQEIRSVIAYSIVNSFYVNRTGEFDMIVYFVGQVYADIGLKISIFSFVTIVVMLLMPKRIVERIKRQLTAWRKFLVI